MHATKRRIQSEHAPTPAFSHKKREHRRTSSERGFSLTELLVVIGIIVLLVGLLLVALGQVQKKARRTRTEATMNQFANACTQFQAEHGFYPGLVPDEFLQFADKPFSSTENANLHLMGGCRVLSPNDPLGGAVDMDYQNYMTQAQSNTPPSDREITFTNTITNQTWKIVVDLRRIGEGSVINGKPYAPTYTPGTGDLAVTNGQVGGNGNDPGIPDLIDGWGQPIVFVKQSRTRGPLVDSTVGARPQFVLDGMSSYLQSTSLGDLSKDQDAQSIFGFGGTGPATQLQRDRLFAELLAHQAFYKSPASAPPGNPLNSAARGAFVLISAGPDGIFFSRTDGPGSPSNPIGASPADYDTKLINAGPRVFDEFDDVRVFGGG